MPVIGHGGGGFGMPVFWDDPGDTGYKYGGPGSPGRGGSGPAATAIAAGSFGGGGGVGFGTPGLGANPAWLMRRRMAGGTMPSGPSPVAGGPGVDPSQFSGSTMFAAPEVGGVMPWQVAGGPKAGAMPQAYGWGDRMPQGRGPMGWGRPGTMPVGGGPAGQPAPAAEAWSLEQALRDAMSGRADQHTWTNILAALVGGETVPGTIFSPEGSSASREARRQEALRTSDAAQQRANLMSRSNWNLDPSQRAFGQFASGINAAGGIARANQDAVAANARAYEDMIRQALFQLAGYQFDTGRSEFNNQWQQRLQPDDGGLGEMIGGIGGRAIGGWLSPGGWYAGAKK